jgi:hypothetical protein
MPSVPITAHSVNDSRVTIIERSDGSIVVKMAAGGVGVALIVSQQELEDISTMFSFYAAGLHRE